MLLPPYQIRADYTADFPISSADLNRRARILASQLPGALRAAGLGAGVLPLFDPTSAPEGTPPLEALTDAANAALFASNAGALWSVSGGAALIELPGGVLVYTQTSGMSAPVQDGANYLHLALRVPENPLAPGALDSILGDAPALLVSELEFEPGALLLAERGEAGEVIDRRALIAPVLLARAMAQLETDLGYNAESRAKGTVAARLNTLETSGDGDGGGGGVSFLGQLHFTAQNDRDAITVIREEIAASAAGVADALVPGQRAVRQPLDSIVHELQISRSELATTQETLRRVMALLLTAPQIETLALDGLTVRPRVVERSQSATIGPNFGSGEQFTPDFEGAGAGKNADGTFGVAP